MRSELFSARTFDAGGSLDDARCEEVRSAVATFGAVHVRETGLSTVADVQRVMPALGFDQPSWFTEGGRASAATQEKWVAPGLRRLDYYPPHLYLLPNNEVQYRRSSPRTVMFACLRPADSGGRVFLHSARAVEARLAVTAPELLSRMVRSGLSIETGFLDAAHPEKGLNYFQSWQERFGTDDPEQALLVARSQTDEYDSCWFTDDHTLMTRITLPARWGDGSLRFLRLAADGPSARNGYRRFPLGDGGELSAREVSLVRDAFLATREGVALSVGDVVVFDNQQFGHSREPFSGVRDVVVAMSSAMSSVCPHPDPLPTGRGRRRFSARTFSSLDFPAINRELDLHGAVHVQHTGLSCDDSGALPGEVLAALRFGGEHAFAWGGLSSGRTTRRALSPELRATDAYPAHLWLLPHNEVLYQREVPQRLLFFSARDVDPHCGGRTFVHCARKLEAFLRARPGGDALLDALRTHGQRIEMGFVDERHPQRHLNYFRSWQERFATDEPDEALARCRAATHQFDECWWRDEGAGLRTLMTRFRVPMFHGDLLLFPRIALDAPAFLNGWRCYPRGDGTPFTDAELELLRDGFLATREGVHWRAGDLLLVDNLRFGHSREAYEGPRTLAVAMAGLVRLS